MKAQPDKLLLTITELSVYLNIKKATLYSWVEQNKIPHLKIHRLIRFRKDEVDAWLRSCYIKKIEPESLHLPVKGTVLDVEEIVARARSSVYNDPCGETGPDLAPGKGG